jgi:hypothetical protein
MAADNNTMVQTLSNRNLLTQILQSASSLQENSETAFNGIVIADAKTRDVAVGVKSLDR